MATQTNPLEVRRITIDGTVDRTEIPPNVWHEARAKRIADSHVVSVEPSSQGKYAELLILFDNPHSREHPAMTKRLLVSQELGDRVADTISGTFFAYDAGLYVLATRDPETQGRGQQYLQGVTSNCVPPNIEKFEIMN